MSIIYEPKGKAREYSPLALNVYLGCDHGCKYCYIRQLRQNNTVPKQRPDLINKLSLELQKHFIGKQVLLSFLGDPYCNLEVKIGITRQILELLNQHNIPTAILTKGGKRCLRDIDVFKQFNNIKIGATLTFIDHDQSIKFEPDAAPPSDRFDTLKILHNAGIRTWASLEPVIDPEQSLEIINVTHNYIDEYQIGKLNYSKLQYQIDWNDFATKTINKLIQLNKEFYIKKDLYQLMTNKQIDKKYIDMDYLILRNKIGNLQESLELV